MSLNRRHILTALAATAFVGPGLAAPASDFTAEERDVVRYFTQRGLKKFLLLNEKRGELMAIEDGRAVLRVPALSGKVKGDDHLVNPAVTPAGFFPLQFYADQTDPDAYINFSITQSNGVRHLYNIHAVPAERYTKGQNRAWRIAQGKAQDRQISNGCVNITSDDYQKISSFAQGAVQKFWSVDKTRYVEDAFFINLSDVSPARTRVILKIPADFRAE